MYVIFKNITGLKNYKDPALWCAVMAKYSDEHIRSASHCPGLNPCYATHGELHVTAEAGGIVITELYMYKSIEL